ncbi:hypothetical protein AAW14_32245 [Streptomyces hygroscopicus]|uniref:hypothetical protein n=1 Tax=Streptomyces hygroscopicus TaxID=1912 RepID=UPI00223F1B13|nr:hypothetical protein [Streptomyces hygroscopicus]MCW7946528.1 hypothetical protein [Streptomyces hygroscopicus]
MRRATPQRTTTTVVAVAAALLLAGCGSQGGRAGSGSVSPSGPASGAPSGSPSAKPSEPSSVPPSGASSPTSTGTGCAPRVQLTAGDTGRVVCLTTGGRISLTLDGTQDRPWTPVRATGSALKASNPGIAVQPGDAVAAFDAVTPGTVRLTSTRPLCAKRPGQKSCLGIQAWTITVTVTKQ